MKLLLTILSLSLLLNCNKNTTVYTRTSLSDFIFADNFPSECEGYGTQSNAPLPFSVSSNPYLSSNSDFLTEFSSQLLSNDPNLMTDVSKGLFSVIKGAGDIGLFGLEFTTETAALWAMERLTEENPDPAHIKLYCSDRLLIQLWSGDAEDPCFHQVRRRVDDLMLR